MQRVAARLGTATMALYRHVPSKGALVALMVDAAIGPPPELAAEADWRAGLTSWARANRDVLLAHPWLPPLVTAPRVLGPNELAWAERALGVLAAAGLPPRRLVDVLLVINSYVRGASADFTGGPRMPGQQELRRSGRADAYPVLTGLLADVSEPVTAELAGSRFELGLGLVLDGVERLLAAQPAHTAGQGLASARGRRPKARAPRAPVR
jgi:AcrR family transcriptional regulator